MSAADYDAAKFHEGLVKHGLIIPVGVQGIFGRNHVFEDVLERFNALVTDLAKDDGAEYFVFPPVIDRKVLEKVDYMDNFPNPAACYPVYPSFSGVVPAEGRLVTMFNWVFRNEPSPEPTRMQSFRVREFVRCGTPDQVVEWRDMWLKRGVTLLESLGLPVQAEVASDPFFGKGGKMLATSQKVSGSNGW